jgi:hypothetical protein
MYGSSPELETIRTLERVIDQQDSTIRELRAELEQRKRFERFAVGEGAWARFKALEAEAERLRDIAKEAKAQYEWMVEDEAANRPTLDFMTREIARIEAALAAKEQNNG